MNISDDSNEHRDVLGPLISVSFGVSRVTGRISSGPSLDQSREHTHVDTEVGVNCGLEYQHSQREYRAYAHFRLDA